MDNTTRKALDQETGEESKRVRDMFIAAAVTGLLAGPRDARSMMSSALVLAVEFADRLMIERAKEK